MFVRTCNVFKTLLYSVIAKKEKKYILVYVVINEVYKPSLRVTNLKSEQSRFRSRKLLISKTENCHERRRLDVALKFPVHILFVHPSNGIVFILVNCIMIYTRSILSPVYVMVTSSYQSSNGGLQCTVIHKISGR